jgi:hypothetical protein
MIETSSRNVESCEPLLDYEFPGELRQKLSMKQSKGGTSLVMGIQHRNISRILWMRLVVTQGLCNWKKALCRAQDLEMTEEGNAK